MEVHQLIAVARSENLFCDESRAIIPLVKHIVKHISPIFCVFFNVVFVLWYNVAITRNENRDSIFLHFVVSAVNCIRERSFSALAASGSLLHRVLRHFLFLHENFMDPIAINSTALFLICFPEACCVDSAKMWLEMLICIYIAHYTICTKK